jgi:hypothetical protein
VRTDVEALCGAHGQVSSGSLAFMPANPPKGYELELF